MELAAFDPFVSTNRAYREKKYRSAKENETDGGSCPARRYAFLILRLQLRFVGGNERANVARHIQ